MICKWKNLYKLQVSLITVNYSKRSLHCPSFKSTAVRWVITPFTAFSSISCVMEAHFGGLHLSVLLVGAGWSRYTFDFKNPHSQKSQGVILRDLKGHAWLKYWLIMRSSPNVERSRHYTNRAIWGSAPSCIKLTVWSCCRACSSGITLVCKSAAYR